MMEQLLSLSPGRHQLLSPSASVPIRQHFFSGEIPRPFFIGVCGGPASGKSEVCDKIIEKMSRLLEKPTSRVAVINMESFYKSLNSNEQLEAQQGAYNFDHPDAIDEKRMVQTLTDISVGKEVKIYGYDYVKNQLDTSNERTILNPDVVLCEGILVFYSEAIRNFFHLKLFVETDSESRLVKRIMRDTSEHGRPLEKVINQYLSFVKPSFEQYCLPTKKYADVIIPRGADNLVALDMIAEHIHDILLGTAKRFDVPSASQTTSLQTRPH